MEKNTSNKFTKNKRLKLCNWIKKNKIFPSNNIIVKDSNIRCCSKYYFYGYCKCNK